MANGDTGWLPSSRRVKCDEQRPVCGRCTSAGQQCRGYNVYTARPRDGPSILDPLSRDYSDALHYYHAVIQPALAPDSQQLWNARIENAQSRREDFIFVVAYTQISMLWRYLGEAVRVDNLRRPPNQPLLVAAWQKCLLYLPKLLGIVIRGIADTDANPMGLGKTLDYVVDLFNYELLTQAWANCQAHAAGYVSLANYHGGVRAIFTWPITPTTSFAYLLVQCIGANTTSSISKQIWIFDSYSNEEIQTILDENPVSAMPCRGYMLVAILRLTQLRVIAARQQYIDSTFLVIGRSEMITGLMKNKKFTAGRARVASAWPEVTHRIFEVTIDLYALLIVTKLELEPGSREREQQMNARGDSIAVFEATEQMEYLYEQFTEMEDCSHLRWPLIVMGAVAASFPQKYRDMVASRLRGIWDQPVPNWGAKWSLEKLEKFWASGKTAWDDCFVDDDFVPCLL
ncbi:fungal zn(2)-Cys(6) binuclear clusterdomain-containing protein [Cordyceps javanica]|uniref:Fungal zn(2)-Cys(6) binuclear clusterdomain-containing protein n=1 Tax=Cordyceps javanica TaxID=43265 RepID=A0A545UMF5_9HYPO|nr:fungal zn(2)-Cys(6) binuclear clusterdomain-containing protein [Cordyceps javanica]